MPEVNGPPTPSRRYPPFYERAVPIALALIAALIVILLLVAAAAALGLIRIA